MKIFISSVVTGFEQFRDAAARAVRDLGHEATRSEEFVASPDAPRRACLADVRKADAVLLLLGARYGAVQLSGLSATHEEYRAARERCPVFVFVQERVEMEPAGRDFLDETQEWASGHVTQRFASPENLQSQVTRALHQWELAQAAGQIDIGAMRARALDLVPDQRSYRGPSICVVVAGGPSQTVLRAAWLDDASSRREIQRDAAYGSPSVLDPDERTSARVEQDYLLLEQDEASLLLAADAAIRVVRSARIQASRGAADYLPVLIEEDVHDQIRTGLAFAGNLLDRVDSDHRLTDLLPVVAIVGAAHSGWRTRAEHRASPGSVTLGLGNEEVIAVELSPPTTKRAALMQRLSEVAEDFTALLRRRIRT